MLEELRTRLDSIDGVLNEDRMNAWNQFDREAGFDPTKDYTPEQVKEMRLTGIEALKKSGLESRYLLLEVRLLGQVEFGKLILRGFDVPYGGHAAVAEEFLREELCPIVPPHFDLPNEWPSNPESYAPYKRIVREAEGLRLVVTGVGGGMFDLKNNAINLRGKSRAFGPVPHEYQGQLRAFLEQLAQRPAYNGFQVNFG